MIESIQWIKSGITKKEKDMDISRRIYLSYSTEVFKWDQELEFYIKDEISKYFKIPFSSIEIAGSWKTGISFYKGTKFTPWSSDLDIAIISPKLFWEFHEKIYEVTSWFSDLTWFKLHKWNPSHATFIHNFNKWYINPIFMPKCRLKSDWINFFNWLSSKYFTTFKSISWCIYSSEFFFEDKQLLCIRKYKENSAMFDSL